MVEAAGGVELVDALDVTAGVVDALDVTAGVVDALDVTAGVVVVVAAVAADPRSR